MKKILAMGLVLSSLQLGAETFRFKYAVGDQYRVLSTVRQDVLINGRLSHNAQILNRIAVRVTEVRGAAGYLECSFQTSEESRGFAGLFSWGTTYESRFWRDDRGYYTIDASYFMPVVRNVPVFPVRDLAVGDSWAAAGEEVHDFRQAFGIPEPLRFPIDVTYRYEGPTRKDGLPMEAVSISYSVFHQVRNPPRTLHLYPTRISGYSRQLLYWDKHLGRPYAYEEEFTFVFTLASGDTVEYRGSAEARVIDAPAMDRARVAAEVKKDIEQLGVRDTSVKEDELGVTLTLDNIQFPADSAELIQFERDKLDRIGAILRKYPERDLLISGHTALAGTERGRKQLSEERARAVGDYLTRRGIRAPDQINYRGLGATQPVADNTTEEGMRRNRRVEITIMEN